ncbi:MAG: hypothetical protein Q9195_004710 [Heterodermia aff. obscurata]
MRLLLSILFGAAGASAQISPNNLAVPNFHISGDGQLSDKIILTPPYPGNRRGAIWAESRNSRPEWQANLDFRVNGPERGGGNLQLWYTKEGQTSIGTSSIYTVGKFDGLVLVVDMYGGRGGKIRGFLNDGSTDYRHHHAVDSLAFGHCDYSYRNLGRPSQIEVKQEANSFQVSVDGKRCLSSDKIKLPSDYYFGISAASADTPDSFEIYKFITATSSSVAREEPQRYQPPQQQQQQQQPNQQQQQQRMFQDTPASQYASQDAQFADLHNKLQIMAHSLDDLFGEIHKLSFSSEGRHQEISRNVMSADQLNAMDQRIQGIEKTVKDYQGEFSRMHRIFENSHSNMMQNLPAQMTEIIHTKSPRMGVFLFLILAFQALLAGSYVIYKRRRASGPKKYL